MWKVVESSVKGTSHQATNTPCQDYSLFKIIEKDSSQIIIAVASDGAGSASHSGFGSNYICNKFIIDIVKRLEEDCTIEDLTHNFFKNWIEMFQKELQSEISSKNLNLRDCACTILGTIVGDSSACFIQIGDGAIVVKEEEGKYDFMFLPQQGEYANQTYFATEPSAKDNLQFLHIDRRISELALFTDGIQNLVINFQTLEVNNDFFFQWFEWLTDVEENAGKISLEDYLGSQKINERTDDDKTLVLAVRLDTSSKQISSN
jgi:hypothetical protein